jgi:hypothetical protein
LTRGGARDEAVGGRARDQLLELAGAALGGDREAPVLDEAALVDEVGDVLARRSPARVVPSRHGVRARFVARQRAPFEQLVEVVTHGRGRYLVSARTTQIACMFGPRRERGTRSLAALGNSICRISPQTAP